MSRLRQKKILSKIIFAILGLAVFLFSYQLGNRYTLSKKPETSAYWLPEAIALEAFSLIDEEGETFDSGDFKGHWTLVIIGDHRLAACKQLVGRYVFAWNRLAHKPSLQNMTRVAFLSLAPAGYSGNELKSFIEFIHPDFVALTGKEAALRQFAAQLGLPESGHNSVQCNTQDSIVALIDPRGQFNALFTGISDPVTISTDLITITQE